MHPHITIICLSREELSASAFYNSALVPISLAECTNVLFFEPPWDSLQSIFTNPFKFLRAIRIKKRLKAYRKFPSTLRCIKLLCIFPWASESNFLRKLNDLFLRIQIWLNIREIPMSKRVLLTYWRNSANVIKMISAVRRIYHCTDEIAGFPWPDEKTRLQAILEEVEVAKAADIVLVTSPTLLNKMSHFNQNVRMLANDVVDFAIFNKAAGADPPEELSGLQRPVIGYVGDLVGFKVDFSLVKEIALHLHQWSFIFIGPYRNDRPLPHIENLHFLGSRRREDIPRYVAAFDACIIPHNTNLYMSHSFPMKFFEYLAMGKPVVATDIPALRPYRKYFYHANNADQFEAALRQSLEDDTREKQQERIQLAASRSWKSRGPKIMKLLVQ